MHARASSKALIVLIVLVAFATVAVQAAGNKSVVTIKKQAKNNGEITFGFTPQEGEQQEINVTVVAKMSPNKVADAVYKELQFTLGDTYKVNLNGVNVVIKSVDKSTFKLVLKGQTVEGISISIK